MPYFAMLDFISFICPMLPEGSIRCSIDAGLDCKSYSLSPGATEINKSEWFLRDLNEEQLPAAAKLHFVLDHL